MVRSAADNSGISPSFLLALLGSVLLHLGVLFGVSLKPPPPAYTPHPIEARLVQAAAMVAPANTPPTPSSPRRLPVSAATTRDAIAAPTPPIAPETIVPKAPLPPTATGEPLAAAAQPGKGDNPPDPTYYPAEQLDEPPHTLGEVQQIYPARARNAGIEGFVTLSLLINERGEVDEIYVVKAQPAGFFEESAIAMLYKLRFSPAIKQGKVVRSRWQKTVRFQLRG